MGINGKNQEEICLGGWVTQAADHPQRPTLGSALLPKTSSGQVMVGHLVKALFLHLRGHLYIRQLPLDQIFHFYISCPVNLKHSKSEEWKVSEKLGCVQIQKLSNVGFIAAMRFVLFITTDRNTGIFLSENSSDIYKTIIYIIKTINNKHNKNTMHYICLYTPWSWRLLQQWEVPLHLPHYTVYTTGSPASLQPAILSFHCSSAPDSCHPDSRARSGRLLCWEPPSAPAWPTQCSCDTCGMEDVMINVSIRECSTKQKALLLFYLQASQILLRAFVVCLFSDLWALLQAVQLLSCCSQLTQD